MLAGWGLGDDLLIADAISPWTLPVALTNAKDETLAGAWSALFKPLYELKDYDGTDYDGPILLGADGKVFNVWRGRHFYAPGGPYASMAGRDATRQLAKNRLDGDPDYEPDDGAPLNPAERASLALWVASFEGKYDVVGKLVDGD